MADATAPVEGVGQSSPIQATWDGAPPRLSDVHLERYLVFVGVTRPTTPTLKALAELQLAHLRSIPFENLNPMLDLPVSLEHDALLEKMLSGTRGGYCFEHNMLLGAALVALGYRVQLLAGRGLVGTEPGEVRPRTHLALLVSSADADERLVDVGFGRTSLSGPLIPEFDTVQHLAGDRYRLLDHDGEWAVESARGAHGPWTTLYLLDPRPVFPIDVEMANHFVATHPLSHMRGNLILLRPTATGKRSVAVGQLVVDETERQERRQLDPAELDAVLRDEFGIVAPRPVEHLLG